MKYIIKREAHRGLDICKKGDNMMEEKNDLMQNIGGGNDKNLRKYLILGGGVFVLFVIGIVVSKFIFNEPKKNNTAVILPPEVQKTEKKEDTALFNDIPVENENEFKKPEVEDKPKEVVEAVEKVKKEQPEEDVEVTKIKPKSNVKEEEVTTELKEEAKKPVIKKIEKPIKPIKPIKKVVEDDKYYIQVAAVTRGEPSKKFLKLIEKNGFKYKIVEVNVKGMKIKRVLVGGFKHYSEAKHNLAEVKKKISSSAFIKRLK